MPSPTFSIVIPTLDRPDTLRSVIASAIELDYDPARYEVVVVDDGSRTNTSAALEPLRGGDLRLSLYRQVTRGVSAARNLGARHADGEMLLFFDDDMLLDPAHLQQLIRAREVHGDALISGVTEFSEETLLALRASPFGRFRIDLERQFAETPGCERLDDGCIVMPSLPGGNLSVRRELFWRLGGFDEDFPAAGAEDLEFTLRAHDAGCELLLDPRIRCLHIDDRVTLRACCAREERHAGGMPVIARKYPDKFADTPYVRENRPISSDDRPRLIAKKAAKWFLALDPMLQAFYALTEVAERLRVPERFLRRLYTTLYGVHLYRGFRRTWTG
jgi:glycosyltransferase involved in cell wall biosynthesis